MKKIVLILVLALVAYQAFQHNYRPRVQPAPETTQSAPDRAPQNGAQFEATGEVVRVLADDNQGSRHQRFIVRLPDGRTVLIAHNLDLAPRVDGIAVGDTVSFSGEYEPNEKGGVVHWTHHDPKGQHVAGWIRHGGHIYQ